MRRQVSLVGVLTLAIGVAVVPSAAAVPDVHVPCDTPSLIKAIGNANAAAGEVRLSLASRCVYRVDGAIGDNGFPVVTGKVELVGAETTITRHPAAPRFRFFQVAAGARLGLEGLTISGGHTRDGDAPGRSGGDGGAILNDGELRVGRSTLAGNRTGDGATGAQDGVGGKGGFGGAIFSAGTLLQVSKSVLKDNVTGRGGWGGDGHRGTDDAVEADARVGAPGGEGGWGGGGGAIANFAGVFELLLSSVDNNRTGAGGPGGAGGRGGDNANGPGGAGGDLGAGGNGGAGGAVDVNDSEVRIHGSQASGNVTGDGGPAGRGGDGGSSGNGGKGGTGGGRHGKYAPKGGDGGSGGAVAIRPGTPGQRSVDVLDLTTTGNRTGNGGDGARGGDGGSPTGRAGNGADGGKGGDGGGVVLVKGLFKAFDSISSRYDGNLTGVGGRGGDGADGVPGAGQGLGGFGGRGGHGGGLFVARANPASLLNDSFLHNATGAGGPGGRSPAPDTPDGGAGQRGMGGGIEVESSASVVGLSNVYFDRNEPNNCGGVPGC